MGPMIGYAKGIELLMQLHYSSLGEKDRRHYAAVEAVKLGRGGITYIAKVLAIDKKTITQGKAELLSEQTAKGLPPGRQRKSGGGREKKDGSL